MSSRLLHLIAVLVLALPLLGCAGKQSVSAGQSLVDEAERTARLHLGDGDNRAVNILVSRAKGALILPGVGNVSFFFSVGGGNALLLARTDEGWTGPAFMAKSSGGFGMQAGVSEMSGVILFMSEEDVRYFIETGATLQAQAAVTLLDEDFEGGRTPEFFETGDVYFIGKRSGMYAGMGFSGGGVSDRTGRNASYHGVEGGSSEQILYTVKSMPEGAAALRELFQKLTILGEAETAVEPETKEKDGTEVPSE